MLLNLSYNSDNIMLYGHFTSLGLSDYEARVMDAVLTHSPTSASSIAKRTGLPRSTVYTVLNTLIGKGFIGTTYKNEVKQFVAEDISSFRRLIDEEKKGVALKERALGALSEVFTTRPGSDHIPNIVFFEGPEGLKKIYLSMIREAGPGATMHILRDEFIWQPLWTFVFEKEWHGRIKRWKKESDIQTRLLINASAEEKRHRAYYASRKGLSYRFLSPADRIVDFGVYIAGDTVSILSLERKNLVGIKITNRHIAQNFITLFNALWKKSKGDA